MLALTFDDGPDPRGTPAVLDALEAVGVSATFFVLGERVRAHSALLRRVIDGGHGVEVHGYEHLRHPESTREAVAGDLDRALAALHEAGIEPTRWRIPWGHLADYTQEIAEARGLRIVGWTSDTHDWRGDSASAMLDATALEHGGIVLAHDGISVGARRDTARATAELVPGLVEKARRSGLEPGPLTPTWPVPIPVGNPNFHPGVVQAA
ncbi:MAG TPA: polysaccharide deacetylase family protein [Solirubrobacter sp.]